jgi:hypothetical protein
MVDFIVGMRLRTTEEKCAECQSRGIRCDHLLPPKLNCEMTEGERKVNEFFAAAQTAPITDATSHNASRPSPGLLENRAGG